MNKKKNRIMDMTVGKPIRLMISFGVPFIVSGLLNQLYNVADSAIVGRLIGVEAFAAVGSAGWLLLLVNNIIGAFTHGFGVMIAQCFGAGDDAMLRRVIGAATLLCVSISVVMTPVSIIFVRPLLMLLNTPADILDLTVIYLSIMFGGILLMFTYNMLSITLFSMGDSKSPVRAMVLSSLANISIDIVLIAVLHMGIAAVAISTLLAQFIASVYCAAVLLRIPQIRLRCSDFTPDKRMILDLIRLGGSPAIRDMATATGGLFVQYMINGYGVEYVAGMAAAAKLRELMGMLGGANALEGTLSIFTAQNYGAEKYGRVKKGVHSASIIALCGSVAVGSFMLICGRWMLQLFIAGSETQALDAGYRCLSVISITLPALHMLYIFRSSLQGMGKTLIPSLSGGVELSMRIIAVLVLPLFLNELGIYMAESMGWIGAVLLLGAGWWYERGKLKDI